VQQGFDDYAEDQEDQEEQEFHRYKQEQRIVELNGSDISQTLSEQELLEYVKMVSLEEKERRPFPAAGLSEPSLVPNSFDEELELALQLSKIEH
jgi:hypothetical protein